MSARIPLLPHADEYDTFCLGPLTERVNVGFTFQTVHSLERVGRAIERYSAGGCCGPTFVRMASFPWFLSWDFSH